MANATDAEAAQAANAISDDVHLSDQLHEQLGSVINEALVLSDETDLGADVSLTAEQEGVITRVAVAGALERLAEVDVDDF